MIFVLLVIAFICTSFFYAVKNVFFEVWRNEKLEIPEGHEKSFNKCRALKENADEVSLTVDFGKTLFSAIFLYSALSILAKLDFFVLGVNLHTALYLIIMLLVLTLFCKLPARTFARVYVPRLIAPFFTAYTLFETLFWPVIALVKAVKSFWYRVFRFHETLSFLSHEERQQLEGGDGHSQELNKDEQEMVRSILEFRETEVSEIMVPRTDTIAVDEGADVTDIIEIINTHGHSRIPVYKENIDHIIGILNVKDLYKSYNRECKAFDGSVNIAPLLRPVYFVPRNKKINVLFQELKKEKIHLAVVVDEYGGTSGIVTLEDILEEIVGEIQDEYDTEEERIKRIDEKTVEMDPKIDIDDVNRLITLELNTQSDDYKTLSGLIMTHSGSVPEQNSEFEIGDLRIKILKMDGHKIAKVRVEIKNQSN